MQDVTITIECQNAAFEQDQAAEVARILRTLAGKIEARPGNMENRSHAETLRDINGNSVGEMRIGELPPMFTE